MTTHYLNSFIMQYIPPFTPYNFRNTIIRRGISIADLARKSNVSIKRLSEACKDQIISYSDQMKITWALQKDYGIPCRRQDLFFTLKI